MRVGDNRLTMHTFLMLNICTFVYTMLFLMLSVKFSVKSSSYLSVQSVYRENCGLLTMTFRLAHIPGIVPICLSLFIFNTNRVPHTSTKEPLDCLVEDSATESAH